MKCVVYLDWSGSDYGSKNNMYGNMAEGTRWGFYARKQQLLSWQHGRRNEMGFLRAKAATAFRVLAIAILSICLFVCLSVTRVDQSKSVQARITKSSPSAA